jgi:site-specific recombinase XerD
MTDLVEAYASDAKVKLGEGTIVAYKSDIREFMEFVKEKGKTIAKINKLDLQDYIISIKEKKGFTKDTLGYHLAAISSFYEFLLFEGKVKFNPVIEVRKRYLQNYKNDGEKHTHKLITIPEAAKIVNSCIDIRDKAMLMVLFKTGIRRGELLSLDVSDVNLKRWIYIAQVNQEANQSQGLFRC